MANESRDKRNWRQFQKLSFDHKKLTKRAKKAEGASTRHAHKFIVQRWANIREIRRHIIGWVLLVGVLIGAVGLQIVWYQSSYRTKAPAAGGTYAEAVLGPIETLNPLYASSSAERSASRLMFSSLYDYDKKGSLRGDLAQSMVIGEEGKTYTITLKPNVLWHDKTRLTADDVVFTIDIIKDSTARVPLRSVWQSISAEAIDEKTVVFKLPATIAAFPHALIFPVIPKHILEGVEPSRLRESNFSTAPIGSGPFNIRLLQTLDNGADRHVVHMGAFEDYHRGTPKLNRYQLHSYDSRDSIAQALRTGEVNGATDLSFGDIEAIDTGRYDITNIPATNGVYALFNTTNPILSDRNVRSALRLAVSTSEVRAQISDKLNPLDLPFLPGQVKSDTLPTAPAPNLERAAALLNEAGWQLDGAVRKKDGHPLSLRLVTVKDSEFERAVESLAKQWRKVGVMVETTIVDATDPNQDVTRNILQPRDYDVLVYELAIGADPDVYVYWHSSQATQSGLNLANYSSDISDDALSSARSRIESDLRQAKYVAFAHQWLADVPAIGLYQSNFAYVHSHRAQTVSSSSILVSPQSRFTEVPYWTVETGTVYKTP